MIPVSRGLYGLAIGWETRAAGLACISAVGFHPMDTPSEKGGAMGTVREVPPAALVAGITFSERAALEMALGNLTGEFGPVEMESPEFSFDMTDY